MTAKKLEPISKKSNNLQLNKASKKSYSMFCFKNSKKELHPTNSKHQKTRNLSGRPPSQKSIKLKQQNLHPIKNIWLNRFKNLSRNLNHVPGATIWDLYAMPEILLPDSYLMVIYLEAATSLYCQKNRNSQKSQNHHQHQNQHQKTVRQHHHSGFSNPSSQELLLPPTITLQNHPQNQLQNTNHNSKLILSPDSKFAHRTPHHSGNTNISDLYHSSDTSNTSGYGKSNHSNQHVSSNLMYDPHKMRIESASSLGSKYILSHSNLFANQQQQNQTQTHPQQHAPQISNQNRISENRASNQNQNHNQNHLQHQTQTQMNSNLISPMTSFYHQQPPQKTICPINSSIINSSSHNSNLTKNSNYNNNVLSPKVTFLETQKPNKRVGKKLASHILYVVPKKEDRLLVRVGESFGLVFSFLTFYSDLV